MRNADELDRLGIESYLERHRGKELLRILTCGSVDDGKSTLIGRLLHDGAGVFDDQLAAVRKDTTRFGTTGEEIDYALLLDGLQAEREQGITIDVAYRYFATHKRKFIVADTPGHEQYTRNMATGASNSDLAVILIDARKGVLPQTRRHAFICSLLGIQHVVVAINKMDLVAYAEEVFDRIKADAIDFFAKLQVKDLHFIPVCARRGENVVERATTMPWYQGGPLLDYLESVHIASDKNLIDLRFPVQHVMRPNLDFRGYAGTLASGILRVGDEVVALPSGRRSRVRGIFNGGEPRHEAFAAMAVTVTLEDEIDVSRGDMLVHPNNAPELGSEIEAMIVWMVEEPLEPGRQLLVKHTTTTTAVTITSLRYRINVSSLRSEQAERLALNEIGRVRLESSRPLPVDPYARNKQTGAFILIDRLTNATLGAGMIVARTPAERALDRDRRSRDAGSNLRSRASDVAPADRFARLAQHPFTIWFTGLPRAGKSSLAFALEKALFDRGRLATVLDGEALRHGLCSDLGFSESDRHEHLRRAAELARLFNDQGLIAIGAFVSPTHESRDRARSIVGAERFALVHCDCPLEVCEARDAEGLYQGAREGEIGNVTGVGAPFEPPAGAELVLDTANDAVAANVSRILEWLEARGLLAPPAGA
jgi:bifunctional enzyme CysN/CysC